MTDQSGRTTVHAYSRLILVLMIAQVSVGIALHFIWVWTGNWAWLGSYFDYPGTLYIVFLDVLKLWLCIVAWKQFREKASLRSAWLTISLAMGLMLAGDLFTHWLSLNTYINPLHYLWPGWNVSAANALQIWGSTIAGPLFMAVLAVGLFQGLQHYRKIGMLGTLRSYDFVLVGAAAIYALYVLVTVARIALNNTSLIGTAWMLTWPNDMLLAVLLLEAILLFRTAADMGKGYIAWAWGAFAVAIFLTVLESIGQWLTAYGYLPYPENAVTWYVWYVWAAAFALGPAYQVDAIRVAKFRVNKQNEPLQNSSIIHAFPGEGPSNRL